MGQPYFINRWWSEDTYRASIYIEWQRNLAICHELDGRLQSSLRMVLDLWVFRKTSQKSPVGLASLVWGQWGDDLWCWIPYFSRKPSNSAPNCAPLSQSSYWVRLIMGRKKFLSDDEWRFCPASVNIEVLIKQDPIWSFLCRDFSISQVKMKKNLFTGNYQSIN